MLRECLERAKNDEPLWLPDLRGQFLRDPTARPLRLRLTLHDGTQRDFPCAVPAWGNEEERGFAAEFLQACVYNILAVYSGRELCFYLDPACGELRELIGELDAAFQLHEEKRRGYGKVISIAERIAGSRGAFRFTQADIKTLRPLPARVRTGAGDLDEKLRAAGAAAKGLRLCGIDVGGTDIKLAASAGDILVCTKEYDWNPAACATAEEIIGPILGLARLMRARLAAEDGGLSPELLAALDAALEKDAGDAQMRSAVEAAEAALGAGIDVLDGIGLSFPDIVIDDRIVGGETPKTEGMRRNSKVDYETAFARIGGLKEELAALCRAGGRVRLTNDGNMAAFTAAMELAHSGEALLLREGVVAHSLGTDLGTGWLTAAGEIPPLPLEMYDLVLDLGSYRSRAWLPADLRSTRNENSGLPGARRYMGQAAAYRLAQQLEPALLAPFTAAEGETLIIAMQPQDLRKPCLERLMQLADEGEPSAREIFRRIGLHLAVVTQEMDFLLHPEAGARFLFGRFVKRPGTFALLEEGFRSREGNIRLLPSDEGLANTPLMRALAAAPDVTVAQFGQAVGAIYFALT